eukprot:gene13028-biopygen7984
MLPVRCDGVAAHADGGMHTQMRRCTFVCTPLIVSEPPLWVQKPGLGRLQGAPPMVGRRPVEALRAATKNVAMPGMDDCLNNSRVHATWPNAGPAFPHPAPWYPTKVFIEPVFSSFHRSSGHPVPAPPPLLRPCRAFLPP